MNCEFLVCLNSSMTFIWFLSASWTKGFGWALCPDGNSRNDESVSPPYYILSHYVDEEDYWRVSDSRNENTYLLTILGFKSYQIWKFNRGLWHLQIMKKQIYNVTVFWCLLAQGASVVSSHPLLRRYDEPPGKRNTAALLRRTQMVHRRSQFGNRI